MKARKTAAFLLASAMVVSTVGLTGCGQSDTAENEFKMWIYEDDGKGTFYEKY